MIAYTLKRLLLVLPVLLGISLLAFFLVRLIPGDTVTAMLGLHYSEADADFLRRKYGLDRSLLTQYFLWLRHILHGDLGISTLNNRAVVDLILERLPVTVELSIISILFAVIVGLPLGILCALRRGRSADYVSSVVGLVGISVPGFWLGTLLILFFSLYLDWLPSGDFRSLADDPLANLRHMILPGLALGTAVAAIVLRMTRSAMLEVLRQDYVRTARAKGLSQTHVIICHTLRNALIPIVTVVGLQAGYLLGGSVVIEQVFSLPGLGKLTLDAIGHRDYPLLQGIVLFIASAFVLINLLVDILYAWLDPRIQYGDDR